MRIIIACALTFSLTLGGTYFFTHEKISELKYEQKLNHTEIAKLEGIIKSANKELDENKSLILNQQNQILELSMEVENLNSELNYYNSLRQLDVVATAYTAFCKGCSGITATGHNVKNTVYKNGYRVVAVDPNVIPLGSLIYVETDSTRFIGISDDTGGSIKVNKIDILVENESLAYNFGKQNAKVTVLRSGYEKS